MAESIPLNVLGTRVSGDLAGITIYTSMRQGKVCFPIDHPKKPPSPAQISLRARFRRAQRAWAALSEGEKATLEHATRCLSLTMTGQNLYISCRITGNQAAYLAVGRQAHVTLPPMEPDSEQ